MDGLNKNYKMFMMMKDRQVKEVTESRTECPTEKKQKRQVAV